MPSSLSLSLSLPKKEEERKAFHFHFLGFFFFFFSPKAKEFALSFVSLFDPSRKKVSEIEHRSIKSMFECLIADIFFSGAFLFSFFFSVFFFGFFLQNVSER